MPTDSPQRSNLYDLAYRVGASFIYAVLRAGIKMGAQVLQIAAT
jgi:hypothetical protein